jgi:hypothetical protein
MDCYADGCGPPQPSPQPGRSSLAIAITCIVLQATRFGLLPVMASLSLCSMEGVAEMSGTSDSARGCARWLTVMEVVVLLTTVFTVVSWVAAVVLGICAVARRAGLRLGVAGLSIAGLNLVVVGAQFVTSIFRALGA